MKKRLLLTGATGFVGKNFILRAKELYDITALVRASTQTEWLDLHGIDTFVYKSCNELIAFLTDNCFSGIVHFASLYLKHHSSSDIDNLIESNIKFPANLIEACSQSKISWFINTGTIWQHFENNDYSPVNLYAATKQAFQDILLFYARKENMKITTLKLGNTYGPGDTRPKIMNVWNSIAGTDQALDMSSGEQKVDFVYISDIVDAYLSLIALMESDSPISESYRLESRDSLTLKQLFQVFCSVTGKKVTVNWNALPEQKQTSTLTWNKDPLVPDWAPEVGIEEGIVKSYLESNCL